MWKKTGEFLLIFSLFVTLNAETIFNASVDKQSVPINDVLQLTISVDGSAELPGLSLPALNDFEVIGQSSSTQIQIINGRQSSSKYFIFTLRPKKQGSAEIPAMEFKHKSDVYKTNPIGITVTGYVTPNAQAKTGSGSFFSMFEDDPFFNQVNQQRNIPEQEVIADVVPLKRYLFVGEKTLVNFKLSYERGFYQGPAIAPLKLDGFVVRDAGDNAKNQKQIELKGKKFYQYIQTKEVYPLNSGTYVINPVQIQYISSPFGGVQTINTKPVEMIARKLPAPQPDNFSGAIGNFKMKVDFDTIADSESGKALPITVTLSGFGNLDMINELNFNLPEGLDVYLDSMETKGTSGLQTKRVFKYFFTPEYGGEYKIPDLEFCYFEPQSGVYQTASFKFPVLQVKGDRAKAKVYNQSGNEVDMEKGSINIKLDNGLIAVIFSFIKKLLLLVVIISALGFAGLFGYQNIFSPLNVLRKKYEKIKNHSNNKHFIEEMHKIFFKVVKLKYKVNLQGMAINEIKEKISDQAKAEIIAEIARKFEELKYIANQQLTVEEKEKIKNKIIILF